MPFLDYFKCWCCKPKPPVNPGHKRAPTKISYDLEKAEGMKRSLRDLEITQPSKAKLETIKPEVIKTETIKVKQLTRYPNI